MVADSEITISTTKHMAGTDSAPFLSYLGRLVSLNEFRGDRSNGVLVADLVSIDVLEADFWPASLRACPGHNFRFARDPTAIRGKPQTGHPKPQVNERMVNAKKTRNL